MNADVTARDQLLCLVGALAFIGLWLYLFWRK